MKKYFFIAMLLTIQSCATTYQAKGFSGGYSEAQIDENTYRVNFEGNGYSSKDQVENMLLYRSAELTNEKGFDWFVVNEREGNEDINNQYGITKLSSTAIIKMYKGTKSESNTRAYDAKSVLKHLGKNLKK